MTIPFYKLQLAGNGFILVDTGIDSLSALTSDRYADAARNLCDKRFGVGATAAIFLSPDNTIRIFNGQGMTSGEADDAILCASRFAFDSGRITNHSIVFKTPRGEKKSGSSRCARIPHNGWIAILHPRRPRNRKQHERNRREYRTGRDEDGFRRHSPS